MTIDERLEAIAMNLELLTRDVQDLTRDMRAAEARLAKDEARADSRFEKIVGAFQIALDSIKRLDNIAAAHEQRIDNLEQR